MEIRVKCPDEIHIPRVSKYGLKGRPDRKKKLHINPEKNVAHCFRCGFGTRDAETFCRQYKINIHQTFSTNVNTLDGTLTPSLSLPEHYSDLFIGPEGSKAKSSYYTAEFHRPPSVLII